MLSPYDELDYRILVKLRENCRKPASEIARELGENERKVRSRIDRMIELGIGKFTVVIDPKTFGYGITVDVFLEIEPEKEKPIIETLLSIPELTYIANEQEAGTISIEGWFRTNEELYFFLRERLPSIDGVKIKNYALVPGILRDIDSWMPDEESFGIKND
jgi:DNA-binding Lrp family transcriptional regulator